MATHCHGQADRGAGRGHRGAPARSGAWRPPGGLGEPDFEAWKRRIDKIDRSWRDRTTHAQPHRQRPSARIPHGPADPAAVGAARRGQSDRHQIWLRRGRLRGLHGAGRWRGDAQLHDLAGRSRKGASSPRSRGCRGTARTRCSRRWSPNRRSSAASAPRASRSPPLRCSRAMPIPARPTSRRRCPTCAAAASIPGWSAPSSAPGGSMRGLRNDRRAPAPGIAPRSCAAVPAMASLELHAVPSTGR